MDLGGISVSITADTSGLTSAVSGAIDSIGRLQSLAGSSGDIKITATDTASSVIASVTSAIAAIPQSYATKISAVDNASASARNIANAVNSIPSSKTVTINLRQSGSLPSTYAKGTKNAAGGLSIVNDQKNVSDPRELILHKGHGYIFDGRNVPVYLSEHDKVFTAAQTEHLLKKLPHYAGGKNNDLSKKWSHDLGMIEFDYKMDFIDETEYYSRLQKYRDENFEKWSEEYREVTLKLKKYSDELLQRESDNMKAVAEEEKDRLEDRLSSYKKNSDRWINYEIKVNNMSTADRIAAYERQLSAYNSMVSDMQASALYSADEMKTIWDDFYAYQSDTLIKLSSLHEQQNQEYYKQWQKDASGWMKIRDTYDDWEEYGDSHVKYYQRCIQRVREFYEAGKIDWYDYMDDTAEYELLLYKAQEEKLDEMFNNQNERIAEARKDFKAQEAALKDSWAVSDRQESISEISSQLKLYKSAVTNRGQEKYNSLEKELTTLKREEELYSLQESNNQTISKMEEEYQSMEKNKSQLLSSLLQKGSDIGSLVNQVVSGIEAISKTISNTIDNSVHNNSKVYVTAADTVELSYWINRSISSRFGGALK